MPAEKFANRPAAEVAVTYTATDLTLEVDDASPFPTTGVFRVILGNTEQTIFRVDSVAGNVFTGAAEAFDGNAAIGVTVKSVGSKGAAERFLQSPSTGEILAYGGLSGVDRYGPIHKGGPIVPADFSWVNQGTASVVDSGGVSTITAPTVTTNVRLRAKSKSGVFMITALCSFDQVAGANSEMGLMLRESGTDKMVGLCMRDKTLLSVQRWTNVTTIGATVSNRTVGSRTRAWLRMSNNGTNIISSYSFDGVNFTQVDSHGKTSSFTTDSDQAGYFVGQRNSAFDQIMSVLSWLES